MDEQNQLPEDLTTLSADDLGAAEESARTEATALSELDPAEMTDAQADRLDALADFLDNVRAEGTRREQAVADRQARAAAAAERINPPTNEGDDETGGDEAPAEDGDEPPAEEPPAEPTTEETPVTDEAPLAVAASAAPRPSRSVARTMRQPANPKPAAQDEGGYLSLTAAADIGGGTGIASGQDLGNIAGAVPAFLGKLSAFPKGRAQAGTYIKHNVAHINRHFDKQGDGLYTSNPDFADVQSLFKAAADERRLQGGSLAKAMVAAGGWCAPSENLYGMCADETLDGILNLATVGVDRGGLNYTPGPDFQDIYTNAGFVQTEAEAIAGETKDCTEVDCPDFQEVRLDAVGICVKAPLLTRAAYPELVQRILEGTVVANQHKVNARIIAAMRTALGTALAPTLTGTPVTWATLTAMEWIIEMQRQAYRLSESQTLEVVAPRWLRVAIRADLANRMGIGAESVSNEQIAQHFAHRGAAIQWVLGYLEVATPTTSVAIPATAEIMVYPAGTFVKGTADVISLDAVYDSADLVTNVYTAAFVEDGVLLAKMCHGGKRITLPVNVNGMLGAAQLDDNWGTAQVENAGAAA